MSKIIGSELRLQLSATEALNPAVAQDIANPGWEEAAARILILRLSPLRDLEGSTSHLVLFSECRRALPSAYIDFSFFPDRRDRALLSAAGLSLFFGLESGREAGDFDLILVSNSFALELVNLGYLFSGSGIPSRASARSFVAAATPAATAPAKGQGSPIVILGGSNAISAGALLFPGAEREEASDSLVDGIFFGEGETAIGELALALTLPGVSREERLERAGAIEGFWAALSGRAAARRLALPHPAPTLRYPVLDSGAASTARIQISAGCPGFCSFCLEGWESRPYREFPVDEIARSARELKAATGASCLEIYSYNFNAHSKVFDIIFELSRVFRRVNFMSQRLDILAESPTLVAAELAADKRSFTLGIEGISDRMRRYYRKGIAEARVDEAIGRLALPAVREIKLFYIIAGSEGDEDIQEFAAFAARTAERRRRAAPGQRILVSAGYLARLPFTPLQYAPLCLDRDKLETIARRIEGACAAAGLEFRLSSDFEEYYVDQLLALGGRALAPWLETSPARGQSYDGKLSRGCAASLESFAAEAGLLDPSFFAEKGEAWRPPLAFADEHHAVLRKQYLLASSFASGRGGLSAPKSPGLEWERRLERLMAAKRGFASILVRLELPPSLAGASEEYRSSWLLRAIFEASPEGASAVFDAEEALFSRGGRLEGMADRFCGAAYYRLIGPDAAAMARAAMAAGLEPREEEPPCERVEAELRLPAELAREAEDALKAWLAEERVGFIESRGPGEAGSPGSKPRLLRPSARDAKKKILIEAELLGPDSAARGSAGSASFAIRLVLGRKARLAACLARMDDAARRATRLTLLGYGE